MSRTITESTINVTLNNMDPDQKIKKEASSMLQGKINGWDDLKIDYKGDLGLQGLTSRAEQIIAKDAYSLALELKNGMMEHIDITWAKSIDDVRKAIQKVKEDAYARGDIDLGIDIEPKIRIAANIDKISTLDAGQDISNEAYQLVKAMADKGEVEFLRGADNALKKDRFGNAIPIIKDRLRHQVADFVSSLHGYYDEMTDASIMTYSGKNNKEKILSIEAPAGASGTMQTDGDWYTTSHFDEVIKSIGNKSEDFKKASDLAKRQAAYASSGMVREKKMLEDEIAKVVDAADLTNVEGKKIDAFKKFNAQSMVVGKKIGDNDVDLNKRSFTMTALPEIGGLLPDEQEIEIPIFDKIQKENETIQQYREHRRMTVKEARENFGFDMFAPGFDGASLIDWESAENMGLSYDRFGNAISAGQGRIEGLKGFFIKVVGLKDRFASDVVTFAGSLEEVINESGDVVEKVQSGGGLKVQLDGLADQINRKGAITFTRMNDARQVQDVNRGGNISMTALAAIHGNDNIIEKYIKKNEDYHAELMSLNNPEALIDFFSAISQEGETNDHFANVRESVLGSQGRVHYGNQREVREAINNHLAKVTERMELLRVEGAQFTQATGDIGMALAMMSLTEDEFDKIESNIASQNTDENQQQLLKKIKTGFEEGSRDTFKERQVVALTLDEARKIEKILNDRGGLEVGHYDEDGNIVYTTKDFNFLRPDQIAMAIKDKHGIRGLEGATAGTRFPFSGEDQRYHAKGKTSNWHEEMYGKGQLHGVTGVSMFDFNLLGANRGDLDGDAFQWLTDPELIPEIAERRRQKNFIEGVTSQRTQRAIGMAIRGSSSENFRDWELITDGDAVGDTLTKQELSANPTDFEIYNDAALAARKTEVGLIANALRASHEAEGTIAQLLKQAKEKLETTTEGTAEANQLEKQIEMLEKDSNALQDLSTRFASIENAVIDAPYTREKLDQYEEYRLAKSGFKALEGSDSVIAQNQEAFTALKLRTVDVIKQGDERYKELKERLEEAGEFFHVVEGQLMTTEDIFKEHKDEWQSGIEDYAQMFSEFQSVDVVGVTQDSFGEVHKINSIMTKGKTMSAAIKELKSRVVESLGGTEIEATLKDSNEFTGAAVEYLKLFQEAQEKALGVKTDLTDDANSMWAKLNQVSEEYKKSMGIIRNVHAQMDVRVEEFFNSQDGKGFDRDVKNQLANTKLKDVIRQYGSKDIADQFDFAVTRIDELQEYMSQFDVASEQMTATFAKVIATEFNQIQDPNDRYSLLEVSSRFMPNLYNSFGSATAEMQVGIQENERTWNQLGLFLKDSGDTQKQFANQLLSMMDQDQLMDGTFVASDRIASIQGAAEQFASGDKLETVFRQLHNTGLFEGDLGTQLSHFSKESTQELKRLQNVINSGGSTELDIYEANQELTNLIEQRKNTLTEFTEALSNNDPIEALGEFKLVKTDSGQTMSASNLRSKMEYALEKSGSPQAIVQLLFDELIKHNKNASEEQKAALDNLENTDGAVEDFANKLSEGLKSGALKDMPSDISSTLESILGDTYKGVEDVLGDHAKNFIEVFKQLSGDYRTIQATANRHNLTPMPENVKLSLEQAEQRRLIKKQFEKETDLTPVSEPTIQQSSKGFAEINANSNDLTQAINNLIMALTAHANVLTGGKVESLYNELQPQPQEMVQKPIMLPGGVDAISKAFGKLAYAMHGKNKDIERSGATDERKVAAANEALERIKQGADAANEVKNIIPMLSKMKSIFNHASGLNMVGRGKTGEIKGLGNFGVKTDELQAQAELMSPEDKKKIIEITDEIKSITNLPNELTNILKENDKTIQTQKLAEYLKNDVQSVVDLVSNFNEVANKDNLNMASLNTAYSAPKTMSIPSSQVSQIQPEQKEQKVHYGFEQSKEAIDSGMKRALERFREAQKLAKETQETIEEISQPKKDFSNIFEDMDASFNKKKHFATYQKEVANIKDELGEDGFVEFLESAANDKQRAMATLFEAIDGNIDKEIGLDAINAYRKIGENVSTSAADGILEGTDLAKDAGSQMGGAIEAGVKEALGINSPSKVMLAIADNVVDTLVNRIKEKSPKAQEEFASLLKGLENQDFKNNYIDQIIEQFGKLENVGWDNIQKTFENMSGGWTLAGAVNDVIHKQGSSLSLSDLNSYIKPFGDDPVKVENTIRKLAGVKKIETEQSHWSTLGTAFDKAFEALRTGKGVLDGDTVEVRTEAEARQLAEFIIEEIAESIQEQIEIGIIKTKDENDKNNTLKAVENRAENLKAYFKQTDVAFNPNSVLEELQFAMVQDSDDNDRIIHGRADEIVREKDFSHIFDNKTGSIKLKDLDVDGKMKNGIGEDYARQLKAYILSEFQKNREEGLESGLTEQEILDNITAAINYIGQADILDADGNYLRTENRKDIVLAEGEQIKDALRSIDGTRDIRSVTMKELDEFSKEVGQTFSAIDKDVQTLKAGQEPKSISEYDITGIHRIKHPHPFSNENSQQLIGDTSNLQPVTTTQKPVEPINQNNVIKELDELQALNSDWSKAMSGGVEGKVQLMKELFIKQRKGYEQAGKSMSELVQLMRAVPGAKEVFEGLDIKHNDPDSIKNIENAMNELIGELEPAAQLQFIKPVKSLISSMQKAGSTIRNATESIQSQYNYAYNNAGTPEADAVIETHNYQNKRLNENHIRAYTRGFESGGQTGADKALQMDVDLAKTTLKQLKEAEASMAKAQKNGLTDVADAYSLQISELRGGLDGIRENLVFLTEAKSEAVQNVFKDIKGLPEEAKRIAQDASKYLAELDANVEVYDEKDFTKQINTITQLGKKVQTAFAQGREGADDLANEYNRALQKALDSPYLEKLKTTNEGLFQQFSEGLVKLAEGPEFTTFNKKIGKLTGKIEGLQANIASDEAAGEAKVKDLANLADLKGQLEIEQARLDVANGAILLTESNIKLQADELSLQEQLVSKLEEEISLRQEALQTAQNDGDLEEAAQQQSKILETTEKLNVEKEKLIGKQNEWNNLTELAKANVEETTEAKRQQTAALQTYLKNMKELADIEKKLIGKTKAQHEGMKGIHEKALANVEAAKENLKVNGEISEEISKIINLKEQELLKELAKKDVLKATTNTYGNLVKSLAHLSVASNSLKKGYTNTVNVLKEMDTALVRISQISSDMDANAMKNLADNAYDASIRTGMAATQYLEATRLWKLAGHEVEEASRRAELTAIGVNIISSLFSNCGNCLKI